MNPTPWVRARKISLAVHVLVLSLPFGTATLSSFFFWQSLFHDSGLALLIVFIAEALALSSLVLYIARISWPLAWLRHALPFISIVPLGWEMYLLLRGNSPGIAIATSGIVTIWFVFLSFRLFRSLEDLFIDPILAAAEVEIERNEQSRIALTSALERLRLLESTRQQMWGEISGMYARSEGIIDIQRPSQPKLAPPAPEATLDNKDEEIWQLILNGATYEQIMGQLGVSSTRISRVKKEHVG